MLGKIYLECVFGDCKGEKFELHNGINKDGRGYQMDVCISDDIQVTRDNHCSIILDEEKGIVKLVPSNGAITYFNNSLLNETVEISENDVFRVGRNELVLRIVK